MPSNSEVITAAELLAPPPSYTAGGRSEVVPAPSPRATEEARGRNRRRTRRSRGSDIVENHPLCAQFLCYLLIFVLVGMMPILLVGVVAGIQNQGCQWKQHDQLKCGPWEKGPVCQQSLATSNESTTVQNEYVALTRVTEPKKPGYGSMWMGKEQKLFLCTFDERSKGESPSNPAEGRAEVWNCQRAECEDVECLEVKAVCNNS